MDICNLIPVLITDNLQSQTTFEPSIDINNCKKFTFTADRAI